MALGLETQFYAFGTEHLSRTAFNEVLTSGNLCGRRAPQQGMGDTTDWAQPPENTLESLRHAIAHFDGIEFDIRITADRELIIHHDRDVSVPKQLLDGKPLYVEEWNLDDLVDLGFLSFQTLLNDTVVRQEWVENGKMGCIEIKRPHPKAATGGGFLGRQKHNKHIADAINMAEERLDEAGVPRANSVFYAFHKGMPASAKLAATSRPWAALIPYIPPYGTRNMQRLQALPQYITMPFRRLVKRHQQQGSSMLPCASEYFESKTRRLPLGRHVGLEGRAYQRLNNSRNGMATYVWPTRPMIEHRLLRAGLTGLTDKADPELTWLPSGHARWKQPGTRPLDEEQWKTLEKADEESHRSVLKSLTSQVPTWQECDQQRRYELVSEWRKRWQWPSSVDDIMAQSEGATPPWATPRIIGHRGSGKTSRPVLHPHSR